MRHRHLALLLLTFPPLTGCIEDNLTVELHTQVHLDGTCTRRVEYVLERVDTDRAGAEAFLVCSAWPYPRLEPWLLLTRVRALENQCFLVSANSAGMNQGIQFVGHSMITDPWGTILASAGDKEVIIKSEIDLGELEAARQQFPALADRKDWLKEAGT